MEKDALEFTAVKEYIKPSLTSLYGVSALDALSPYPTWEEARHQWALIKEMLELFQEKRVLHFEPIPDLSSLLKIISKEGTVIDGQDLILLASALQTISSLKRDISGTGTGLSDIAKNINPLAQLIDEINSTIQKSGEIADSASSELKKLRARFRSVRASTLEKMESILKGLNTHSIVMEDLITTRSDRFVLPLSHDYGRYVKGITHDYSRTKQTVYVEPLEVVEQNNHLNQLKSLIRDEELKILKHLTSLARRVVSQIQTNFYLYGKLDLIHAFSLWAIDTKSTIPTLSTEGISIRGARHPILLERLGRHGSVAIDLNLPANTDCLIISGPNAGGKTVALKTLGLLITMAKSGLPITANASKIPYIGKIWAAIDSTQDIKNDLSSFSAQVSTLKYIYEHLEPGDMVLLDEPGANTDPDQGGAIAVACIDAFRKKGAYVIVTSHLSLVKTYGITHSKVENATTTFDDEHIKPLYVLEYGTVGQSKALEIMRSIDFPKEIIDEAAKIVSGGEHSALSKALSDVSKTSQLKKQASEDVEKASQLRKNAEEELMEIEKIKLQTALKYKRLLGEMDKLSRRLRKEDNLKKEASRIAQMAGQELEEVLAKTSAIAEKTLRLKEGARAKVKGTDTEGIIHNLDSDTVEIISSNKKIKVPIDQIEVLEKDFLHQTTTPSPMHIVKQRVFSVVVVGMRVDEALPVIEKELDNALLSGQESLEIIHGGGTGRLKNAIRDYLKHLPFVKGIKNAPVLDGGENKTIVEF
jgi:DNA mismatch repair protein MutS2